MFSLAIASSDSTRGTSVAGSGAAAAAVVAALISSSEGAVMVGSALSGR